MTRDNRTRLLASCALIGSLTLAGCTATTASPEPTESAGLATGPVEDGGLVGADAVALQEALEAGEVTSVELVEAYLDRIAAYEEPYADQRGLSAVIQLNEDALADAEMLDAEREAGDVRGPLHGIPVLVKEHVNIEGMPTPIRGSRYGDALDEIPAPQDAFAVAKLREAGRSYWRTRAPALVRTARSTRTGSRAAAARATASGSRPATRRSVSAATPAAPRESPARGPRPSGSARRRTWSAWVARGSTATGPTPSARSL